MSLQRSLQKGRKADAGDHSMGRPQVGHLTGGALTRGYGQQLRTKRTSPSACVARAASPFQVRKRTLQR